MNRHFIILALIAGWQALPAAAQAPHGGSGNQPRDDINATSYQACRNLNGAERTQCLREQAPVFDCNQAPDPKRCARHRQARQDCRDKPGEEQRDCLRQAFAQP